VRPLAPPPESLEGFPAYLLLQNQRLYRIHRADREPWWFTSKGKMRFDLQEPNGTCYLAEDPVAAFVEVFQEWMDSFVPEHEINTRLLATLFPPRDLVIADCTSPRAARFGLTAEIHSVSDRSLTQPWAAAFMKTGFAGVRYFARHDPSQTHVAIALFGRAGAASWPRMSSAFIEGSLIAQVEREFGVQVRLPPS
jgi:hypothetical protein